MTRISLVFLLFCMFLHQIPSHKIVIFVPTLGNSQLFFNYRIGELLAASGHDVVMYRPQLNPSAQAGVPKLVREIRFKAYLDEERYKVEQSKRIAMAFSNENSFKRLNFIVEMMYNSCETQISNKDLMGRLKAEKFDVAISHMYDFCPLGIIKASGE